MAYATNSLNLLIPRVGEGTDAGSLSAALWVYRSADARATVIAAGYVDDGVAKGVRVNDIVLVVEDDTVATIHVVTVVAANGDVTMTARPAIP